MRIFFRSCEVWGCLIAGSLCLLAETPSIKELAAPALVPPEINHSPLPEYAPEKLTYAMNIGIERTPGGRLWACWVAGGDNDLAYFVMATSDDDGKTWSPPRFVLDPHDKTLPYKRRTIVGNLWTDPQGRLWLFFDQAMTYFDGRAGLWATVCGNPDDPRPEWSAPVRIWHGCALNKPIVLGNGDWLLAVALWRVPGHGPFKGAFPELDEFRVVNVFASSDQGKTWQRRGGVRFEAHSFDETQLVERRDGSIWMTTRTGRGIFESTSTDGGYSWSVPQKAQIGHLDSRHFMRRLASGRLLLVKHGHAIDEVTPSRSHLTAFLSDDEGETWKGGLLLDEREKVTYPDGFQAPDGTIFVSYDFDRDHHGQILMARFTEEDVLAGDFQAPDSQARIFVSRAEGLDRKRAVRRWAGAVEAQVEKGRLPLAPEQKETLLAALKEVRRAAEKEDLPALTPAFEALAKQQTQLDSVLTPAMRKNLSDLQAALPQLWSELDSLRSAPLSHE